jgi:fatty acid desaturase
MQTLKVSQIDGAGARNAIAMTHVIISYGLGVGLLTVNEWLLNGIGVILLIHSLILSATFVHEFIHGNIFKERKFNEFWGQAMTHLNGACYATWQDLVQHHFNHHLHHADFVAYDISGYVKQLPWIFRKLVVFLEWAYFPAFEFILRFQLMLAPFQNSQMQHLRLRTLALFAYRSALFIVLGMISLKALILYCFAYVCFVNLMRFVDAFHHTYDYAIFGQPFPKRDRIYEQEHTFSNLVSVNYLWFNLLFLNFGYHNAHHHDMRCPWYDLPQLHEKLYGKDAKNLLPLPQLISNYHRFRLDRLFGGQGKVEDILETTAFTGGIGVSFLTPPQTLCTNF